MGARCGTDLRDELDLHAAHGLVEGKRAAGATLDVDGPGRGDGAVWVRAVVGRRQPPDLPCESRLADVGGDWELDGASVADGDRVGALWRLKGAQGAEAAVIAVHAHFPRRVAGSCPELHLRLDGPSVRADDDFRWRLLVAVRPSAERSALHGRSSRVRRVHHPAVVIVGCTRASWHHSATVTSVSSSGCSTVLLPHLRWRQPSGCGGRRR